MDENKNSTPESTPEENNINPAQPEANTAGPGEGKNKRSLRNTILTCISIALVLFAAIIVLRQYVYLPGKYEAPPPPWSPLPRLWRPRRSLPPTSKKYP